MEDIRLIIWDMDETFWNGTLTEGEIEIPDAHKELIIELTKRGIINSICSKNNFEDVKQKLESYGIWQYFVFPEISWSSKGSALKRIIENVKLRPETVLFIDDNPSNCEEAKFYIPGINIAGPEMICTILDSPYFRGKNDEKFSRLNQYKLLEKKNVDKKKFESNEEFLIQSGIQVKMIRTGLFEKLDRIEELNQRTNQLNYTKVRLSREELEEMILDETIDTGYVEVKDNYGDYGIIGFFALKDNCLLQFYFSCRTLGLGVEQWVYAQLKFPKVKTVGEVAVELIPNILPRWINLKNEKSEDTSVSNKNVKILLIGGCDLEQTAFYLEQIGIRFDSQFNYLVNGRFECHPECSEILRGSVEYTDDEKRYLVEECPFYDELTFENKFFSEQYDVIIYSPLIDMSIGVYSSKKYTNLMAVYGNMDFPNLTNHGYMSVIEQNSFREKFMFHGKMEIRRFKENLQWIRNYIPENTKLLVLNGSIVDVEHLYEPKRYKLHIEMNAVLDEFCKNHSNTYLIDITKFIKDDADHTDSIRHYTRKIYFKIANEIISFLMKNEYLDIETPVKAQKELKLNFRTEAKRLMRRVGLLDMAYKIYNKAEKIFGGGHVTIIIPVYKTEKYLRSSVQSVFDQSYPEIDVILVDDGSPDNCPLLCDQIASENDNVRVIHKENGGLSSARNAGLDAVYPETSFVLFLDSDDRLVHNAIAGLVRKACDTNADIVIPDRYIKVDDISGKETIALHFTTDMYDYDPKQFAMNVLMEQGRGWRATALLYSFPAIQEAEARFPIGRISEDITFNLLLLSSVKKISFYPYPTLLCLKREESITTTFKPDFAQDIWFIDIQAHAFLLRVGLENAVGQEKVDALLCRNLIIYLFSIMSKRNHMPYREKVREASSLISHQNARDVVRKKHKIPYFENRKVQQSISFVYYLLRHKRDNLVFRMLSII